MQARRALGALIEHSGMSDRAVSLTLGKAETWARNSKGRDTKTSTLAAVADLAGVDVVLIDRETGERVGVIDPPGRGE